MATPTFKRLTLDQFAQLLLQFPFTRQINAIHLHHSGQRQRDFRGHASIVARWRAHTAAGLADIAQHLSIDPQGWIWLGRNWNLAPASAAGHNGNPQFGPFMLELAGDFDSGNDNLQGIQLENCLQVIAMLQDRFALPLDSLAFHSDMAAQSCPGNSLDREQMLCGVQELRNLGVLHGGTRNSDTLGDDPFPQEDDLFIRAAIDALTRRPAGDGNTDAAQHLQHEEAAMIDHEQAANTATPAGDELGAARLAAMRPHLVNLGQGCFAEGDCKSTAADIDAIFEQHLPRAVADASAAGRRLPLLLLAQSGLQRESAALRSADRQILWWKANGVYPLYFIWESGIAEALGNLIQRGVQGATGGHVSLASDSLAESVCRSLGGPTLWNGIKYSAARASAPGGGACYVAERLLAFCAAHPDAIELHAIAHSAGAQFHAHFLRCLYDMGAPRLTSLQLLAPALRVDTFQQQIGELIASGELAARLTLFCMSRDYELADSCTTLYRKSLLCLVQNALEEQRDTPLLGLEQSLRSDPAMKRLFGLDGREAIGEVIWAVTADDSGRSASCASSHAAFADDPVTLNSALLRLLDLPDAAELQALPAGSSEDLWSGVVDWPQEVQQMQRGWFSSLFSGLFNNPAHKPQRIESLPPPPSGLSPNKPPVVQPVNSLPIPGPTPPPAIPNTQPLPPAVSAPAVLPPAVVQPSIPVSGGGRRAALLIGINAYPNPQHRLNGCVADTQSWANTLSRLGFTCNLLHDAQATRSNIERGLRDLVSNARAGDVIVFMYSGHGTHVNDLNGDEDDGQDEAICPVDFATGSLFIDDDIASILATLPAGVNLTMIMDCCHSGTNSRFAVGSDSGQPLAADARRRYVMPTPELNQAHAAFRRLLPEQPRPAGSGGQEQMNHVKFAACQDREVAWESNGQGEFTVRATRVLSQSASLTHQQFIEQVTAAFGASPRQHPLLDCASAARHRQMFAPLARASRGLEEVDPQLLASTLQQLQLLLTQMNGR